MRGPVVAWAAWVLGAAALAGCKETVGSEHIRTGGIAMLTEVVATSDTRTRVQTELRVGGDESNTYVVLKPGDRLLAIADGDEKTMRDISDGVYQADFDIAEADTEFEVVLERDEDETAAGNVGTLPAPFEITSGFGVIALSREHDDFEITWEPADSDDRMHLEFDDGGSNCIDEFDSDGDVTDDGSQVVRAGTLDSSSEEGCRVEAILTRHRNGTIGSKLDDESWFRLRQERRVAFNSDP